MTDQARQNTDFRLRTGYNSAKRQKVSPDGNRMLAELDDDDIYSNANES